MGERNETLNLKLGSGSPNVKVEKAPKRCFFGAVSIFSGEARVLPNWEKGGVNRLARNCFQRFTGVARTGRKSKNPWKDVDLSFSTPRLCPCLLVRRFFFLISRLYIGLVKLLSKCPDN